MDLNKYLIIDFSHPFICIFLSVFFFLQHICLIKLHTLLYIYVCVCVCTYTDTSDHKDQNDVKKKSKCEITLFLKLLTTFYQGKIRI